MLRRLLRSPTHAFVVLLAIGILVRTWVLFTMVPPDYIAPHAEWETDAVAVSLATTGAFADPYALPTGPTAHVAPVWPFLLGLVYRALGLTLTAGYVGWGLGLLAYALLFALLPWMSDRLGVGTPAGVLAGLAGAVLWVWWPDPAQALAGLALGLVLVGFLGRWTGAGPKPWASCFTGVACAVAVHTQPALLPVIVGCVAFELWYRRHGSGRRATAALVAGLVLGCIPWTVRNSQALGAPVFVRSNFGLELRVAFHDGVHADLDVSDQRRPLRHPRTDAREAQRLRAIGELAYMREARRQALAWIADHPRQTLGLIAQRFAYFWFGPLHDPPTAVPYMALTLLAFVGLLRLRPRLTTPERAAILIPLVAYPPVYYLMGAMTRYRLPLDWLLLILAATAVVAWSRFRNERPASRGGDAEPIRTAVS
jgi:hypothetical protein